MYVKQPVQQRDDNTEKLLLFFSTLKSFISLSLPTLSTEEFIILLGGKKCIFG